MFQIFFLFGFHQFSIFSQQVGNCKLKPNQGEPSKPSFILETRLKNDGTIPRSFPKTKICFGKTHLFSFKSKTDCSENKSMG